MGAAIWQNDAGRWRLASPQPYADEAALHSRVEEAPEILPLSGTPDLVVVGREVGLGPGYADLIAIELSGRLVVIEVKLARNPEARRAVVAQILTYASYLRGRSIEELETQTLASHLAKRGHASLADLLAANDQKGAFDRASFEDALRTNLDEGRFRLVLVLDAVPDELVQLVGYLELITDDKVVIDLITVSAYEINGTQILVPQRVDPEQQRAQAPTPQARVNGGRLVEGEEDFAAEIDRAPSDQQPALRELLEWARSLLRLPAIRLQTYHGKNVVTLLPRLRADNAGLVTIGKDDHGASLWFFRSVFERRAPSSIAHLEAVLGDEIRQGNTTRRITPQLLSALTNAYREAAEGHVSAPSDSS